jgi:hypothetical protein
MMGVLYYLQFSAAKATDVSTFKCDRIETLPLRVAATGRSLYASPSMFGAAFRWLGTFNGRVPESTTAIRVEAREPEPALFDEDQCNAGDEGDIDVSSACCELHAHRFREWAAQAPSSLDGPWGSTVGELAVEILRRTKQPEFTDDVCDGPTDEDPTGTLPLVETFEAAVRQPAAGGGPNVSKRHAFVGGDGAKYCKGIVVLIQQPGDFVHQGGDIAAPDLAYPVPLQEAGEVPAVDFLERRSSLRRRRAQRTLIPAEHPR